MVTLRKVREKKIEMYPRRFQARPFQVARSLIPGILESRSCPIHLGACVGGTLINVRGFQLRSEDGQLSETTLITVH